MSPKLLQCIGGVLVIYRETAYEARLGTSITGKQADIETGRNVGGKDPNNELPN